MPWMCSVTGCKSNYKSEKGKRNITTFCLPKNKIKEQWLHNIPTDISKLKKPRICIKHFEEKYIIKVDEIVIKNEIKEFERKYPKLRSDAVPTIFQGLPSIQKDLSVSLNIGQEAVAKKRVPENLRKANTTVVLEKVTDFLVGKLQSVDKSDTIDSAIDKFTTIHDSDSDKQKVKVMSKTPPQTATSLYSENVKKEAEEMDYGELAIKRENIDIYDIKPDVVNIKYIKSEIKQEEDDISEFTVVSNENTELFSSKAQSSGFALKPGASSDSTDTADESDEITDVKFSRPRKRLKKTYLDVRLKEEILNLYEKELRDSPEITVVDVAQRVASQTGVGRSSVFTTIREYKKNHRFSQPKRNKNRKTMINILGDAEKQAIRRKVHEFIVRNELPTVDKILREVNDDTGLPDFKRSTFYKVLKELNFKCQKSGSNSMLMDRDEIVRWRRDYLKKIKRYRDENRKIYYLGEQTISHGLLTGLTNTTGKEKRLIICHIGSVDGFVPDCLCAFESKKTNDHHEELCSRSFEKWFSNVLPRLDDNSVIVLDNAPYHSRRVETFPNTASRKPAIQNWLRSKNIDFKDSLSREKLLAIVGQRKAEYNKFVIDEMARGQNKTVLRLPPYHFELNPIELIWEDARIYISDHNATLKFTDVKAMFCDALKTVTVEKWRKCIRRVEEQVEVEMWQLDNNMETHIDTNNDDTSSSSE